MQVSANSKYIRMSPKKTHILVNSIKKMHPKDAIDRLSMTNGKGALLLAKVIKAALSNATNNFKLNENNLTFQSIEIGKGPHFKRWQPVARGMAHQIKKRTTHIKIVLEEKKIPREGKVPQGPRAKKALDTRDTRDSRGTS